MERLAQTESNDTSFILEAPSPPRMFVVPIEQIADGQVRVLQPQRLTTELGS
jgi:hypothetical protein